MTTHISPQGEQPISTTNAMEDAQSALPLQPSAPHPIVLPMQPEEEEFFSFEEEQPDHEAAFVDPFQRSHAMPTISAQAQPSGEAFAIHTASAPTTKTSRKPRFSLTVIAIIVCVIVIIGLLVTNVVAQTTPPLQTHGNGSLQTPSSLQQKPKGNQPKPPRKPTTVPPAAQVHKPLDPKQWRYVGGIPDTSTPGDEQHYSLLSHMRHLLAKDPTLQQIGLQGGLDIWLYRNAEKILEWSSAARDTWAGGLQTDLIHRHMIRVLDYKD